MTWWNDYIGKPFAEKGRGPAEFDCWGLVCQVFKDVRGIALPSYLDKYETTNDRDALGVVIGKESKEKWHEVEKPQALDVIILRMRGVPMHVGVVTKPGFMIHCARGIGVVHEKYDSIKWRSNVMGFVRHEQFVNLCGTRTVQQ